VEVIEDYIRINIDVESFEKSLNPWRMLLGKISTTNGGRKRQG